MPSSSASSSVNRDSYYVPPPSIGHEMGIMFGFLAIMLLSMLLYGLAWQVGNKRSARKEVERIETLRASGWLKEKIPGDGALDEKTEVVTKAQAQAQAQAQAGEAGEITEIK